MRMIFVTLLFSFPSFCVSLNINPVCDPEEILIDTVIVNGIEYHKIILDTYPLQMSGSGCAGSPSLPYIVKTFLLPPDTEIADLTVSNEKWTALPGKYFLYPAQDGVIGDSTFTLPDSLIYSMEFPFPEEPVGYPSQGSAMGYSIVTLTGTPVRYTPVDSLVEVLTRMRISFDLIPSTHERISPIRETDLCAEVRQTSILGLVANPELLGMYESPRVSDRGSNYSSLNVFDAPTPEGDGVDMVIITSGPGDAGSDLTGAFQELADYRTAQGIITVVRSIGWIEGTYSGCDTQEKIRNFLRDAHENWGVQAAILGGDDWIVPVRNYDMNLHGKYYAADDYYADLDGDWTSEGDCWSISGTSAYVDILVGRLPVDNATDIQVILDKIVTYETQPDNSNGFCRSLLLMASNEIGGSVSEFQSLKTSLVQSGAVPDYLTTPVELYWMPDASPSLESFTRSNVIQAFDTGYNLSIHCDHSDIHEIGAGGDDPHLSIHDYDFSSMSNEGRAGILWTMGCSPGSFAENECFAEAGLLTDSETGFAAVIANTTLGTGGDEVWSQSFCDALYSTGWTQWDSQMPLNWPLSYLGQAFRHQKNFKPVNDFNDHNYVKHHLFGDPFMFVWRDSPSALTVFSTPSSGITTGVQTISVLVTELDMGYPVPVYDATVCIWNVDGNDVFALGRTNSSGIVVFADLEISQTGDLFVTATKRRDGFDVAAYLPGSETITVMQASGALVCLDSVVIDDDNSGDSQGSDDGVVNPGETIEVNITAVNNGNATANYVTAELSVVSGGEHIVNIPTSQISFSDIPSGASRTGNSPFVFTINENVESYSSIEFKIEFSYNLNQTWESPYFCTIFSESYSIPLVDITSSQTLRQVAINLTDFLIVNSGTGTGLDLEMTVSAVYPSESFTCNTIDNLGSLSPDECLETLSQLNLVVTPANPQTSPWTNQSSLNDCTFDIQISGNGGEFAAKRVDFNQVRNTVSFGSIVLDIIEADDNSLELEWAFGTGTADIVGFYIYYKKNGSSSNMVRSTSLPIPVAIGQLASLDAETEYIIDVTAVDAVGRESSPGAGIFSTTCEIVSGWPVQLEGATGTGPVIINMDGDAAKEIVTASSFGYVYIIQPDGQTECIPPPSSLDFDRFVSISVGDVDNDNDNEIVVTCQLDIVDGVAAVLLYDNIAGSWQRSILDDTIGPNETVCGAAATGTPVLLQANASSTLEIALRTKGTSTSLHMWQWDSGSQDWIEPTGFPISLSGDFFSEPIAVDFDDDGYDELIVTQIVDNYSTFHVVDFYTGGFSEYNIQLTELGIDGRVYSTLAAVEYNGEVYVTGVAKYADNQKKLFVYDITSPNTGMIWYSSNMQSGADLWGNMGGPAIGYANTDGIPDLFYALNGMSAWQLMSEQQISNLGPMDFNAHSGVLGDVKSVTIAAGTTLASSIVTVPFVGFSSKYYGHDPLNSMDVLPGFPTWTESPSWTAPAVGDVDNDGLYEVLTANDSGELTLYDWDGNPTPNSWPMYQHDSHRTGFFNSGRSIDGFDIELTHTEITHLLRDSYSLLLSVKVTGVNTVPRNQFCSDFETQQNDEVSAVVQAADSGDSYLRRHEQDSSCRVSEEMHEFIAFNEEIDVAVYSNQDLIGSGTISLVDGLHDISVPITRNCPAKFTVIIDPRNRYSETDETNNSQSVVNTATGSYSDFTVSLQSPSDMISATVFIPDGYTTGINFAVYSVDGRLQSSGFTESLAPGTQRIDLLPGGEGGHIPSGVYFVHICIAEEDTIIRKVVIL